MCVATYQLPGVAKDNHPSRLLKGAIDLSVVNDRVRLKKRARVSELQAGGGRANTLADEASSHGLPDPKIRALRHSRGAVHVPADR